CWRRGSIRKDGQMPKTVTESLKAKLLSTAKSSTEMPIKREPVTGVTGLNYIALARAFIGLNGGTGFMVSTENQTTKTGDRLVETLHEWGAWRAYFLGHGLRMQVKVMDRIGYYMVPTQWPHEFDAGATSNADYDAGNEFNRLTQNDRARRTVDLRIDRAVVSATMRARFNASRPGL
ncbi:MAG: hypothetical protein ACREJC_17595, partial [Tepidisphaeraceae bacterium]